MRERPRGASVLAVARAHTLAVAERVLAQPDSTRSAFRKVISGTPSVHARMRELSLRFEEALAEQLAAELEITGQIPRRASPPTRWPR